MSYYSRFGVSRLTTALAFILTAACAGGKKDAAKTPPTAKYKSLKDVIETVPLSYFAGTWNSVSTVLSDGQPSKLTIDIKGRTLKEHVGEERIEEIIPVDSGYALLVYVPNFPDPKKKKGIHTAIVLKRLDKDTIAMIQSPDLFSIYVRERKK